MLSPPPPVGALALAPVPSPSPSNASTSPMSVVHSRHSGGGIGWQRVHSVVAILHALRARHTKQRSHSTSLSRLHASAVVHDAIGSVPAHLSRSIDLLTKPITRTHAEQQMSLEEEAAVEYDARRNAALQHPYSDAIAHHTHAEADETDLEEGVQSPILHIGGVSSRLVDDMRLVQAFIEQLGAALFVAGLPAHMVAFYLTLTSKHFDLHMRITSTYNGFIAQFDESEACRLIHGTPGNLSLDKICEICTCTEGILKGLTSPIEGLSQLEVILAKPSSYHAWLMIPSTALFCAAYCPLFNGGWHEMVVATVGGLFTGLLDMASPGNSTLERGHDVLCGLLTALFAVLYHSYVRPISLMAAILSGVCWALPGLRLTLAVIDTSTGHPVNGMAQFFGGGLTLANLGIGIAAGLQLLSLTHGDGNFFSHPAADHSFEVWSWPIFGLISVLPLMVLFDATWAHLPQLLVSTAVAFVVSTWGTEALGTASGTWLSALALGLVGNAYGRRTRWPGIELILFSVLILLPGAIGVQGMLAQDSLSTVSFLVQMMVVVLAIVTGLLTANAILKPDAAIRT